MNTSTIEAEWGMVLWILPLCLQPLIALAMVLRGLIGSFPIFFVYTLFVSARDFVLLFVQHNRNIYSWIYFLAEPLAIVLGVAVVYEVLWQFVRPYEPVRALGARLFWGSLAIAGLAGLLMLRTSEYGQRNLWIESLVLLERSARFVQVGVLIVFIFFISQLGLTWKHYAVGIVAGFGVAAGLQLVLFELRSAHAIPSGTFKLLDSMAYNIAVLIWATYFLSPRIETTSPRATLPQSDLPRWDEILRRYLRR